MYAPPFCRHFLWLLALIPTPSPHMSTLPHSSPYIPTFPHTSQVLPKRKAGLLGFLALASAALEPGEVLLLLLAAAADPSAAVHT